MKLRILIASMAVLFASSCSKIITNKIADGLSGGSGGSVFTNDTDPELMADALPLALKMYEAMLETTPEHVELHRATASAFTAYAYAFIQFPADTLPLEEAALKKHMNTRAKNMYLRAREYALKGLDIRYPDFVKGLKENVDSTLALTNEDDIDILYWTGMSWMGAFTASKMNDMRLMISVPKAIKIMERVKELNPDYGNGAIDEFFISYYGGMPEPQQDLEKAKIHFDRAVELTDGNSAGPYLAYASAVLINAQDRNGFETMIKKASKIKPSAEEENVLLRTIQQQKAKWYLTHLDDLFI